MKTNSKLLNILCNNNSLYKYLYNIYICIKRAYIIYYISFIISIKNKLTYNKVAANNIYIQYNIAIASFFFFKLQ